MGAVEVVEEGEANGAESNFPPQLLHQLRDIAFSVLQFLHSFFPVDDAEEVEGDDGG